MPPSQSVTILQIRLFKRAGTVRTLTSISNAVLRNLGGKLGTTCARWAVRPNNIRRDIPPLVISDCPSYVILVPEFFSFFFFGSASNSREENPSYMYTRRVIPDDHMRFRSRVSFTGSSLGRRGKKGKNKCIMISDKIHAYHLS